MRSIVTDLAPTIEASGPHDFAVRVRTFRHARVRVHRIPLPTSVTIASAPLWRERDGDWYEMIWVGREQENFYDEVSSGSITLFARPFFLFWRNGIWAASVRASVH